MNKSTKRGSANNFLTHTTKEKGITLIALVVTIIVLIILAGISINLVLGENGIIQKAKQSKVAQTEAEVKEKVEMILAEYAMEREFNNKTLLTFLQEKKTKNEIDEVTDNGDGTYTIELDGYEITIQESSLSIIDILSADGIRVTAKIANTTGWVKNLSDGVIINGTIRAFNTNITSATISKDGTKLQDLELNEKGEYSYKATANGIYKIEAVASNETIGSKEIKLEIKEDSTAPNEFTPTATVEQNTITITAEATDNEGGSGIDYYEYSVKLDGIEKNTNLKSNTVTVTEYGTFEIKVTAYDKTGNSVEGTTNVEVEDPAKYYLLKSGVSFIDRTGSWLEDRFGDNRVNITYPDNTIKIDTWEVTKINRKGKVTTSNYIDFSEYSSLNIEFSYTGNQTVDNTGYIKLTPESGTEISYSFVLGETSKIIDISALTGGYTISFENGYYSSLTINSIYLVE